MNESTPPLHALCGYCKACFPFVVRLCKAGGAGGRALSASVLAASHSHSLCPGSSWYQSPAFVVIVLKLPEPAHCVLEDKY